MKNWLEKLDDFLVFNEKEILDNAGVVSHCDMELRVRRELEKYNRKLLNS